MLTGIQIRASRSALRWSVVELAERSGVSVRTIKRMEVQDLEPKSNMPNLRAVRLAFESAGIEFIGGPDDAPGIRIHKAESTK
jgi:predicted transcriptional regulator